MAEHETVKSPRRDMVDLSETVAEWGLLTSITLLPVSHLAPWSYLARGALAVAAAAGLAVVIRRGEIEIPNSPITLALMLFVVVSTASVIWSVDPYEGSQAVSKVLLRIFVVFLLIAGGSREPARLKRLGMALALGGLVLASVCLVYLFGGVRNPWGGITGSTIGYNRVCMYLIPPASFVLCFALREIRFDRQSWLWRLAWIVTLTAIFLTFSRIGWLAAVILLLVWWCFSNWQQRRFLVASCVVALALFLVMVPDLGTILAVTDNSRLLVAEGVDLDLSLMKPMRWMDLITLNDRATYAWKPALTLIHDRPILGAGYGPSTFMRLIPSEATLLTHEHNALLSVAVQSGIVGALVFVALLVVIVRSLLLDLKTTSRTDSFVIRGLEIAVLAAILSEYVVQGIGEPINNGKMGVILGILAAFATVLTTPENGYFSMRLKPRKPGSGRSDAV